LFALVDLTDYDSDLCKIMLQQPDRIAVVKSWCTQTAYPNLFCYPETTLLRHNNDMQC